VGKVTASVDTSHYKGRITKAVTVTTDEPGAKPVALELQAEVMTAVDILPNDLPVLRATAGDATQATVTLAASDGKPFDVLGVQADRSVKVAVAPADADGTHPKAPRHMRGKVATGSSRYTVTIVATDRATLGQSFANVTLATSLPKAKSVPIRVALFVTGAVQAVPGRLVLAPTTEVPVFHVKITKTAGKPLKLLGVASADPEFTATTATVTPGRVYDLAVRYRGKPGRGAIDSRIVVRTNEPQQAELLIPITGRL
jgi:hypothetical protein